MNSCNAKTQPPGRRQTAERVASRSFLMKESLCEILNGFVSADRIPYFLGAGLPPLGKNGAIFVNSYAQQFPRVKPVIFFHPALSKSAIFSVVTLQLPDSVFEETMHGSNRQAIAPVGQFANIPIFPEINMRADLFASCFKTSPITELTIWPMLYINSRKIIGDENLCAGKHVH